jgi:hypothetical protein
MLIQPLHEFAGLGNIVTWTFCNWGQRQMALNWWRHMEEQVPDAKPHVVCLDLESESYLRTYGVRTNRAITPHTVSRDNLEFRRSIAWTRITVMKILISWEILNAGHTAFYSDTDVVVRRDPRGSLMKMIHDSEILFQINHFKRICSGIYFARSTPQTLRLFDLDSPGLPQYQHTNPQYGDQTFIEDRIAVMGQDLHWSFLPAAGFPNGVIWYNNRKSLRHQAEMIHFNCLVGTAEKIKEMIADGVWSVEN